MDATQGDRQRLLRIEGVLAGLLRYGALAASAWLALGMVLGGLEGTSVRIPVPAAVSQACLAIGIVLLIALPVLRVAIMSLVFFLEKDYRFAAIAGAVLAIITIGFLLGVLNSRVDFQ